MPASPKELVNQYPARLLEDKRFTVHQRRPVVHVDGTDWLLDLRLTWREVPVYLDVLETICVQGQSLALGLCCYSLYYTPLMPPEGRARVLQMDNQSERGARRVTDEFHQYRNYVNGKFFGPGQPREPAACPLGVYQVVEHVCDTWIPALIDTHARRLEQEKKRRQKQKQKK